jgi:hypothetical protein
LSLARSEPPNARPVALDAREAVIVRKRAENAFF